MKSEGVEKEKVKIKNILWEERFFPWNGSIIIAPIIYKLSPGPIISYTVN